MSLKKEKKTMDNNHLKEMARKFLKGFVLAGKSSLTVSQDEDPRVLAMGYLAMGALMCRTYGMPMPVIAQTINMSTPQGLAEAKVIAGQEWADKLFAEHLPLADAFGQNAKGGSA